MTPTIKGIPNRPQPRPKGLTFIDGLQLLFIAFQLAHIINWSWFLVMMPTIGRFLLRWVINSVEERNRSKGK